MSSIPEPRMMFGIDWKRDYDKLKIDRDRRNPQDIYIFRSSHVETSAWAVIVPIFYVEGTIGL